jgi:hypothetical protein
LSDGVFFNVLANEKSMNPFTAVLNDLGLSNNATGPAGALYVVLTFGRDQYASTVSTNPFSEVKRLLLASTGRSLGYQEMERLLTSGETRWAQTH